MNTGIVRILEEISFFLDMKGIEFKPRAYEKAAAAIASLQEDVRDIYKRGGLKALEEIPGIGQSIAEKIEEYIKTRRIREHIKLRKQFPIKVVELSVIEGLGPKTVLKLYKKLGIKTLAQLERSARSGKLARVIGSKTQDKILRAIGFAKQSAGRQPIGFILSELERILDELRAVPGVRCAEFAGSVRRMQETVGDVDILAISDSPRRVMEQFVHLPQVAAIHSRGTSKTSVRLKLGLDADLQVVPPESFGAAWQYFTGDKYHNIALREIAAKKGYKLNEYGLFKGKSRIAGKTEEEIYEKLGFAWMPPEIRTNTGELEVARRQSRGKQKGIPKLIGYDELRGDLQIQTDWTDGEHSISEMAHAAQDAGLEYICITDHTKSLAMTGGCDEKKLLRQITEIDRLQKKFKKFKILKGAEVNIMKDGSLDIKDTVLAKLDVVGAAVHSHFNLPEREQTTRIIRAMENKHVDIIFHPTCRLIGRRSAISLNMDSILKAAKRTKTVLEINAYPDRLDLKDEYIRKAVDLGVKLAINSDAHAKSHFVCLRFGIGQARRGWACAKDVINTRPWRKMLKLLK